MNLSLNFLLFGYFSFNTLLYKPPFFKERYSLHPMTLKCVFIGDSGVGKTSLIKSILGLQKQKVSPTSVDNYSYSIVVDNKPHHFSIWDIGGSLSTQNIRTLSYPQTCIFILCYSIDDEPSFNNLKNWYFEIKKYKRPLIIIGTKSDKNCEVSEKSEKRYAWWIGAACTMRCSAVSLHNIGRVFVNVVLAIQNPPGRKNFCCFF